MNRARAAALSLAAAALAACSDADAPASRSASEGPPDASGERSETTATAASAPAAPAAGASLGEGGALTGSVSGLTGQVTAFQVEVTETSTIVQLAADVLFDFDSAELGGRAPEQLRRAADLIRDGGAGDIPVVGHTDSKGTDAYNDDLSRRRADAVARWLSTQGGVQPGRLKPQGRGEREPIAPNVTPAGADAPAGRASNRRVVLTIPRRAP